MPSDCRLYLITPPVLPPGFAASLAEALGAADIAAVRLHLPGAGQDALRQAVAELAPVVQPRGAALILANDPALAASTVCDGVHLDPGGAIPTPQARKLIGDLQLGVFCAASRDAAMTAGEEGADYVAFDAAAEDIAALIAWWTELMELPAVAEGGITAANCAPLVQAGADFLAVGDAVWNNADGPAAAIRALTAAMEAA